MPSSWNECDYIYIASGQLLPQGALCCNQQSDDHDEQALGESGEEKLPLNRGRYLPWPIWDEREEKKERRQKTHYKRQPDNQLENWTKKSQWLKLEQKPHTCEEYTNWEIYLWPQLKNKLNTANV